MNLNEAILFVFFILILLWVIKADFLFIILGIASFLFFLIILFSENPLDITISVLNFLFLNPFGLFLIFTPLLLYILKEGIKKRMSQKRE